MRWGILALGLALLLGAPPATAEEGPLAERVRAALEAFAGPRLPDRSARLEIPALHDFEVAGLDPARAEIGLSTRSPSPFRGRVPVTVALSQGGREWKRGVVTLRVRIERPVVVARRPLVRGEILTREDLELVRRDAESLPVGAVARLDELVGQRLRRSVAAGRPVSVDRVEWPPVVNRGDRVPLLLVRGGLRIDGVGTAREDGVAGETIRVLNLSSRREVSGRVTPEGVVHVHF